VTDAVTARQHFITHPLIAVFVPFLVLWISVIRYVGEALAELGMDLFPPLLPALLLLAATTEVVSGNALTRKRVGGILPRIRELVVVLLIAFASIVALFGGIGTLMRGDGVDLARVEIWVSLGIVALQWVLTYVLHTKLREREAFADFFISVDSSKRAETYAAHSYEAGSSLQAIQEVRRITIGLQVVGIALVVLATWPLSYAPSTWESILAVLLFGGLFFITGVLSRFLQMQGALSSGRVFSTDDVFRRDVVALILLAVLMGIAAVLAGQRSLLPVELFPIAWSWLVSIRGEREEIGPVEMPDLGNVRESGEFGFGPPPTPDIATQGAQQSPLSDWVPWIALGVGVAFVIVFLVTPLFQSGERPRGIRGLLKALGVRILVLIQAAHATAQRIIGMARQSSSALGRQVHSVWKSRTEHFSRRRRTVRGYGSDEAEARRTKNRALRHFMRLVKWGESRGAPFARSLGPLEYAARVSMKAPDRKIEIHEAAVMFEQIVFARDHGDEVLVHQYQQKVNKIVTSK
jgi:hypothetical protein